MERDVMKNRTKNRDTLFAFQPNKGAGLSLFLFLAVKLPEAQRSDGFVILK